MAPFVLSFLPVPPLHLGAKKCNSNTHERIDVNGTERSPIFCTLRDFNPGGYPEAALPSSSFTGTELFQTSSPFDLVFLRSGRVSFHWLWVTGMRLPSGTYLIVVSSPCDDALERYKQRWQIEVLFEALKSRGFSLEETRLRDAKRLETLCGVLATAFCWAYMWVPGGMSSSRFNSRRIKGPPKACFAMDLTALAEPCSMRRTSGSSLSTSWAYSGGRSLRPKHLFIHSTQYNFVLYSG